MNYFEFKQQLLKDSFTKDEEFHRLRKEDLRCAKAYDEAMAFEKKLKQALNVKVPDNLKDSIVLRQTTAHVLQTSMRRYAIAATMFLSFVIASAAWYVKQPGPIEEFVINELKKKPEVFISQQDLPRQEVEALFASLNTKVSEDLGQVRFMKTCPTPGGTGVRMVLMTDSGPVTILYMPNTELKQQVDFELNNYKGRVVAMENGAAAIIGTNASQISYMENKIQSSLRSL